MLEKVLNKSVPMWVFILVLIGYAILWYAIGIISAHDVLLENADINSVTNILRLFGR